jgi:fructose-1-phosphate kinase PfkB-like protein
LEGIADAGVKANRSTAIAGGEGSKFAKGMVDFGLTLAWTAHRGGFMEETMEQKLARLEAENQALKGRRSGNLSLKVSEKGGLSVYGLGRFPVTLYKEQWVKLLGFAGEIESFIKENESQLKTKGE